MNKQQRCLFMKILSCLALAIGLTTAKIAIKSNS